MGKAYSLDTCTCIDVIRNQNPKVRQNFGRAVKGGDTIAISSIALHELWYGVIKSGAPSHRRALELFSTGVQTLQFDEADAMMAGDVRASLAARGLGIGPFDTLIAGQALARKMIVVTTNEVEFKRVAGLGIVNWRQ